MPRKGWILFRSGKRQEVPEPLLDEEQISWPPTLPEKQPGEKTRMITPKDLYRRHEIVPGEAYIYLQTNRELQEVSEDTIREILGPHASGRRRNS